VKELDEKFVIHGDIKIDNFLVNENNHVCISDFGFAIDLSKEKKFETNQITSWGNSESLPPNIIIGHKYDPPIDCSKINIYGLSFVIEEICKLQNIDEEFLNILVNKMKNQDPEQRISVVQSISDLEDYMFASNESQDIDEIKKMISITKSIDYGDILKMNYHVRKVENSN